MHVLINYILYTYSAIIHCLQSFEVLEAEMLDGQKLQGPLTAKEVHEYLTKEGKTDQ